LESTSFYSVIFTTEGPQCKNSGLKINKLVQDLQMFSSWLLSWSEYYCCW